MTTTLPQVQVLNYLEKQQLTRPILDMSCREEILLRSGVKVSERLIEKVQKRVSSTSPHGITLDIILIHCVWYLISRHYTRHRPDPLCLVPHLRIDNTALLAEKAVISLMTPFFSGEVKALCIPDAICDVIVGNVEGARSPEDPDMSVMVGATTTRAQTKREAVTKPLRVPDIERHVGVDREQLFKLQQEDPRILALVDAGKTSRRGGKIVFFEKARGIVYRRYQDLGRNVDVKQVVLPKSLREYVMSVAHDSITGADLGIRRTKDKVLSNFYWPGVDGDVTKYCRSCDVCQRTVKKGTVPRVPLEKVPLIDTLFKKVTIDLVGPINPPSEAGHRFILTLVDYATRFAEAVPLRKIDTESVAEALVDIYSRLGVPEEVLSDQGTQFISDCMKEVCRLLGIKQKTTTPYHPMCNGLVERFNATLKTCLCRLCSEQPRQWHRYINPLLFAYREVPQESTHFASFELMNGGLCEGPCISCVSFGRRRTKNQA
ncbi:gypsy retrotransposon integrase-like protein 1 [Plakobranchus ocellatus]|uniref:Gypsy retrotransposon integrase-like protein 1 n=1 Tax=Plakobranchus ocellatus TaxID=259542 RepID=A0AAV4BFV6_9GAST|nr:gypsy retrotransposon integrase-like protein 1 [Plakobranchus ocellatus]